MEYFRTCIISYFSNWNIFFEIIKKIELLISFCPVLWKLLKDLLKDLALPFLYLLHLKYEYFSQIFCGIIVVHLGRYYLFFPIWFDI